MNAEDQLFQRFGKVFPPGTVLCKEGEQGREMYVIQSGKVRISKKVRDVEKILVELGDGAFFGEMSILNNKPRSATATVTEESKILVIDPKTFEAMIRGNAEIAIRLIKILADRLQEADDQIENLLLKDANSQVVHALSNSADKKGVRVEGGTMVKSDVGSLAAQTGLQPEKVQEVLDKLAKAKLVVQAQGGLVISNVDKLRKFLEFLAMKEQFGDLE